MTRPINKKHAVALLEKADKLKKTELKRTIFVPGPDSGDKLARGAASATFAVPKVSEWRWDYAFLDEVAYEKKYGEPK